MVTAVVAAAGTGERLDASSPKALVELAGRPLTAWCLLAFEASSSVERVVIVAPAGFEHELAELAREVAVSLEVEVTVGGASRSQSVANGLAAAGGAPVVVVHDAARPLVTAELIDRCVAQLERWGCDGVVAAARAIDTIKESNAGGRVIATLERHALWVVQTPQAFRADALRNALARARLDRAYDDAQLMEATGGDVRVVEAPRENLKVTTPLDLRVAELVLADRSSA